MLSCYSDVVGSGYSLNVYLGFGDFDLHAYINIWYNLKEM